MTGIEKIEIRGMTGIGEEQKLKGGEAETSRDVHALQNS
jgi:hypothetical protein